MKTLLNFEYFKIIQESNKNLDLFLDNIYQQSLNENLAAIIGNPIKYSKIKANAKEYQKSLVQVAINNLDFEKKKAAGTMDKNQEGVLKAANAQKNQALKDKASAISQKMDSLATTGPLKTVVSIAKNKSQVAAAEISAKVADGEEAKALKLKIQGLNKKIKDNQEELEDYKSANDDDQKFDNVKTDDGETIKSQKDKEEKEKAEAEKEKAEKAKQDKIDAANVEIEKAKKDLDTAKQGDDEGAKLDAEIAFKNAQIKKAQAEENEELVKGLKDDIIELQKKKSEITTGKGEPGEGEPGEGEPGKGEPGKGEPGEGEPGKGEPGKGEPGKGEPGEGEPGKGEPGKGEPGEGEPGKGEPGEGEPGKGEPKSSRPESGKNSKDDLISRYTALLNKTDDPKKKKEIQDKIDNLKKEENESFLNPNFLSIVEAEISNFEFMIDRKYEYLNESISERFKRILSLRNH